MSLQLTLNALSDPPRREILHLRKSGSLAAGAIAARLFAEELADAAQDVAHLVQLDLGLDAVDELVDLIVRQVDADEFLDDRDGIAVELCHQRLVIHELLNDFFDFCLDIHGVSLLFVMVEFYHAFWGLST